MVYLVIKEVIPASDEVIIITSSLMKDMNSANELYRANAIRVLCRIIDPSMLLQIERYLKQAVVDRSPAVAAAALAGAQVLAKAGGADVIRRWTSEVGEAMSSSQPMVVYQAVALAHALRAQDRLAVNKLVSQLTRGAASTGRSPLAQCLLIRYVSQVVADSAPPAGPSAPPRPFYDFLESCLRSKSESVIFEAARAICGLKGVTAKELTPAVTVLQLFLSSSKPVLRFAAVRTLDRIAAQHPLAVTNCNIDLEGLIGDGNRSIATLAISTLLKTSGENGVERLLKRIGGFMGELGDEFRVVVVRAVAGLCVKFPTKHRSLMAFLAGALREDGGYMFKRSVVDALTRLVWAVPESREIALGHLAEFIEDCEFTALSVRVLHLLGREGPSSPDPARYVRVIYNRVVLENAAVRAAALSALRSFGARCPVLRARVAVLLRRALHDTDDEVRDRAALYLNELESGGEARETTSEKEEEGDELAPSTPPAPLPDPRALITALREYLDAGETEEAFDLSSVAPTPGRGLAASPAKRGDEHTGLTNGYGAPVTSGGGLAASTTSAAIVSLASVPELADLPAVFQTTGPFALTEEETEYKVDASVHTLSDGERIVLEFTVANTVAEQVLENVSVALELEDDGWEVEREVALAEAPRDGSAGSIYVVLLRPADVLLPVPARFGCGLRFVVKEIDPTIGEPEEEGYADEYELESLELGLGTFVAPGVAPAGFRAVWEALPEDSERVDEYALGAREDGIPGVVDAMLGLLEGFAALEGSDAIAPGARSHALLLVGSLPGNRSVAVRIAFGIDARREVAVKLAVRSSEPEISEAIHALVQDA